MDEFQIPDMAEVAATAALAGVRSGSSVQIVRAVLAAAGPHLMAAELHLQADALDDEPDLSVAARITFRNLARRLRGRAFDLEQGTL